VAFATQQPPPIVDDMQEDDVSTKSRMVIFLLHLGEHAGIEKISQWSFDGLINHAGVHAEVDGKPYWSARPETS
jgi:hypothetical protein